MTTIAFDTLAYSKRLRDAGFSEQQAFAEAEALRDALEEVAKTKDYATKNDLADLKFELIKWMIGLFFAQCALVIGILFKIVH